MGKTSTLIVLLVCCMAGVSCSGSGTSNFVGNNEASPRISGNNTTAPQGTIHNPDVLEQVLALAPPGGVDVELFAELQNELARQVSTRASQQMQFHAPVGEANRINDLMYDGTGLSWAYSNAGDYDFNGEVNAADITPIVRHYGKTTDSVDWLVAQAADGDGNGEINLGDIASIAIYFGSIVQGYVVLGGDSEAAYPSNPSELGGPGTLNLGGVNLSGMETDRAGRQMLSFATHIQLDTNLFWVRPVYGDLFGDASYPSTNVGEGLDFHVKRLNDFNLHDPALDDSFFVIPNRSADEVTLDIWTTDTQAEAYVAFRIVPDLAKFSISESNLTFEFETGDSFPSETIEFQSETGAMVKHLDGPLVHNGPLAQFTFNFEPYYSSPPGFRVGVTSVNETYASVFGSDPFELEGFTVNKPDAQPGQPASFTLYSVFMTGDGDDNGTINVYDIKQMVFQGTFGSDTSSTDFAPAATDYDSNNYIGMSDIVIVGKHIYEAVDSIEILIWDTGEYADEAQAMTFRFFDGTPSKRHEAYPFTATDWRDVFRTWDGEITIGMMQAADMNGDGEVLVSARLRYEDQFGLPFTGIPFTYSE